MSCFKELKKRSQEESRADDSVFEKRLGIYKRSHTEITNSLSEFYEVINIDANNEIPLISQKIIEKLSIN
jgi:adenylate kinase family enzyme